MAAVFESGVPWPRNTPPSGAREIVEDISGGVRLGDEENRPSRQRFSNVSRMPLCSSWIPAKIGSVGLASTFSRVGGWSTEVDTGVGGEIDGL